MAARLPSSRWWCLAWLTLVGIMCSVHLLLRPTRHPKMNLAPSQWGPTLLPCGTPTLPLSPIPLRCLAHTLLINILASLRLMQSPVLVLTMLDHYHLCHGLLHRLVCPYVVCHPSFIPARRDSRLQGLCLRILHCRYHCDRARYRWNQSPGQPYVCRSDF